MQKKVSIIIPIHNTMKHLERCIKSVLSQTYKNLEIILVDDGSTDGSSGICDQYKELDSRIIVIHKNFREGVVSARKSAIALATGYYSLCVDSDDWIEPEMVTMLEKEMSAQNADIVTSGFFKDYANDSIAMADSIPEGIYIEGGRDGFLYQKMCCNDSIELPGILCSIWNKLFKTELLRRIMQDVDNRIFFAEDVTIVYSYIANARCVVIKHDAYYHYVMHDSSATHSSHKMYLQNLELCFECLKNNIKNNKYYSILMNQLEIVILKLLFSGINSFMEISANNHIPYYLFPLENIKTGSNIIIYGAGNVGRSFYKQIAADKRFNIIAWVDANYKSYQNMNVESIEKIKDLNFDYLILALKYGDTASNAKNRLIEEYQIEENKIIWREPEVFLDKYLNISNMQ